MSTAMAAYVGTVIGAGCCIAHFIYCRVVCKTWAPLLRLLGSTIAGFGAISAIQLGAIVFRPPTGEAATIRVDDYRVSLFIGMLAVLAVSAFALYDNWRDMHRQPRKKKRP